ncbi:MAG: beta-lactamase family protein, partial [Parvularculaceae bacterium]|nr:beta-lactamase family protein [Parvularculaceae bacterium]
MIHDQIGTVRGRDEFIDLVRKNICGDRSMKPIRRLDPNATRIVPLYDDGEVYGALQFGLHSFFLQEPNKEPFLTSTARFVTEWHSTPNGLKVQRTYSFDHLDPSENHPMDADVLSAGFDQQFAIEALLAAHNVKAQSIAVLRDGALAEVRNFGRQDANTPVSMDTLYNVASLAKPITAMTVLRLVDAGRWNLDEPIAQYALEDVLKEDPRAQVVTTRHILSHTSGLPNWRYLTESGELSLLFEPGERFEYSGEGFEWLRRAVEARTGRSLEDLAQELVFTPAGMTSTSYLYPTGDEDRVASRYDEVGDQIEITPHTQANAAANLITTAEDYGRFLVFVAHGGGLNDALAQDMITTQTQQSGEIDFGLGWSILRLPSGTVLQHSGADPGVRSLAIVWPESGEGVVFLSNASGAIPTWQLTLVELFGQD